MNHTGHRKISSSVRRAIADTTNACDRHVHDSDGNKMFALTFYEVSRSCFGPLYNTLRERRMTSKPRSEDSEESESLEESDNGDSSGDGTDTDTGLSTESMVLQTLHGTSTDLANGPQMAAQAAPVHQGAIPHSASFAKGCAQQSQPQRDKTRLHFRKTTRGR